ncbi:hypothetical protein V5O48_003979 [Marasmius crinis-equi]|uniref:SET domain-containing protein n=1 Tax=Marasmius crinis-equi TaxID=585013 RepID=A0ABR3FS74_9AGAR
MIMVPSTATIPLHWPKEIKYIRNCCFHSSVSQNVGKFIATGAGTGGTVTKNTNNKNLQKGAQNVVIIRRISSDGHPAKGQHGLFASRKIPPKTRILDYIGELHCDDRPNSDYDLSLHRFQTGESVGIDASTMGNEARFINDYRGIQTKPNAVFMDYRTPGGELRMGIWSGNEEIKKGSEILVRSEFTQVLHGFCGG